MVETVTNYNTVSSYYKAFLKNSMYFHGVTLNFSVGIIINRIKFINHVDSNNQLITKYADLLLLAFKPTMMIKSLWLEYQLSTGENTRYYKWSTFYNVGLTYLTSRTLAIKKEY